MTHLLNKEIFEYYNGALIVPNNISVKARQLLTQGDIIVAVMKSQELRSVRRLHYASHMGFLSFFLFSKFNSEDPIYGNFRC